MISALGEAVNYKVMDTEGTMLLKRTDAVGRKFYAEGKRRCDRGACADHEDI